MKYRESKSAALESISSLDIGFFFYVSSGHVSSGHNFQLEISSQGTFFKGFSVLGYQNMSNKDFHKLFALISAVNIPEN